MVQYRYKEGGERMTDRELLEKLLEKVTSIELVLENEIRPNQKALAEGFMALNEKLDRHGSIVQDVNYQVRLSILESEVRELKQKIG